MTMIGLIFLCLFQYKKLETINSLPQRKENISINILLYDNIGDLVTNKRYPTSHCEWVGEPLFPLSDPFEVNKQIIHYVNNSMVVQPSVSNTICYCTDDQYYNCSIDELGPVYPGQTLKFDILVINITENLIEIFADKMHPTSCGSHSAEEDMLLFSGNCTKMEYKSIRMMVVVISFLV